MSKASALAQWLREYLANGPKPSKEVINSARQQFGISELTVNRAWSDLKYKLNRELPPDEQVRDAHTIVGPWCSFRLGGHWFWGDKRQVRKPERNVDRDPEGKEAPPISLKPFLNFAPSKRTKVLQRASEEQLWELQKEILDRGLEIGLPRAERESLLRLIDFELRRRNPLDEEDSAEPTPAPADIPIWKDSAMWLAFPIMAKKNSEALRRYISEIESQPNWYKDADMQNCWSKLQEAIKLAAQPAQESQ